MRNTWCLQYKRFIYTLGAKNLSIYEEDKPTQQIVVFLLERIFGNIPLGDLGQTPYQLRSRV